MRRASYTPSSCPVTPQPDPVLLFIQQAQLLAGVRLRRKVGERPRARKRDREPSFIAMRRAAAAGRSAVASG
jgi:hypothetical protein